MGLNFMLIDDNEIDLFVNRKFIERTVGDVEILTFIRAKKALDFLSSLSIHTSSDYHFLPDIILLDLNMPEMGGFEFLDAYSRLQNKSLTKTKIFMLSSSTNVKDRVDADRHIACQGFLSKPLSCEIVQKILENLIPALN
ncbi:response regulator [Muricauda sp. ANG21]|uniref:response regulator n=1 Tax=Allomuricauda sp. ANG21 TaxID=3042468 RepID=UPI003452CE60